MQELRQLAEKHENFSYVPCVSDEQTESENITQGHVLDVCAFRACKTDRLARFSMRQSQYGKGSQEEDFSDRSLDERYLLGCIYPGQLSDLQTVGNQLDVNTRVLGIPNCRKNCSETLVCSLRSGNINIAIF